MTLYQLEEEFRQISAELFDNDGEITPELEQKMTINADNLERKAVGYAMVIKEEEAELKAIEAHIKYLTEKKKTKEGKIEALKKRVAYAMDLYGKADVKTPLGKIWLQRSTALEIIDKDAIPEEYILVQQVIKIDNAALKSAVIAGQVPESIAKISGEPIFRSSL